MAHSKIQFSQFAVSRRVDSAAGYDTSPGGGDTDTAVAADTTAARFNITIDMIQVAFATRAVAGGSATRMVLQCPGTFLWNDASGKLPYEEGFSGAPASNMNLIRLKVNSQLTSRNNVFWKVQQLDQDLAGALPPAMGASRRRLVPDLLLWQRPVLSSSLAKT